MCIASYGIRAKVHHGTTEDLRDRVYANEVLAPINAVHAAKVYGLGDHASFTCTYGRLTNMARPALAAPDPRNHAGLLSDQSDAGAVSWPAARRRGDDLVESVEVQALRLPRLNR